MGNGVGGVEPAVGTLLGPEGADPARRPSAGRAGALTSSGAFLISHRSTVDASCGRRVGAGGVVRGVTGWSLRTAQWTRASSLIAVPAPDGVWGVL